MWVRIKARTIGNDDVDSLKCVCVGGGGGDALEESVMRNFRIGLNMRAVRIKARTNGTVSMN